MSSTKRSKQRRNRNENGSVTLMSAFAIAFLVLLSAFALDFGLYYYQGAKLQNAVDAAAVAVGSSFESTDSSLEGVALSYLQKNGIDVEDKYKDAINVRIERKGVLDSETIDYDYITSGYIKLIVTIDSDAVAANIFNIDSWKLQKSAFVKCDVNYVEMPRALKYSLFAGSTNGSTNNPALEINGRTGDVTNYVVSTLEMVINGVNEKIVQPIIGIFGGTPNMTDLVHINISEAITNGDVYSNSNISIGVQALNAARVKDQDYTGTETNSVDENTEILPDENEYDDYGQVTYTAVDSIVFTNTSRDASTHVYVQNQQYIEQTQNALTILNEMNLSSISSTADLQREYRRKAESYLENKVTVTNAQKQKIIDQADNLAYNDDGTISLQNQSMIVYDVSQGDAKTLLNMANEQTLSGVVDELNIVGTDELYASGTTTPKFLNIADKASKGGIKYSIVISHKDVDGNDLDDVNVNVQGAQINRDLQKTGASVTTTTNATVTGAKFALTRTFQEKLGTDGYIPVPNMKPYFVRQVNQSIRNATKTREDFGESVAAGDRTVREAVKTMSGDLEDLLEKTSYEDNTYSDVSDYTKKDTSLLFTRYKRTKNEGLSTLTEDAHTTFMGEKLYNSNDKLKTPAEFTKEFWEKNIAPDANGESKYSKGAVKTYYNDNVAGNYAADAVQKKKDSLTGKYGSQFSSKQAEVNATNVEESNLPTLPYRKNIFLGPDMSEFTSLGLIGDYTAYAEREKFNAQMNYTLAGVTGGTVDIIMPTYNDNGNGTITVNMIGGSTWGGGSTESRTLTSSSKPSSKDSDMAGKYYSGFSVSGFHPYVSSNGSSLVTGDAKSEKGFWGNGGNLDVGQGGGSNATLIVTGSISVEEELQVRQNCILYCTGNISTGKLLVEPGGKIYCNGSISVSGNSNIGNNALVSAKGNFTTKTINLGEGSYLNAYGIAEFKSNSKTEYVDTATSTVKASTIIFTGNDDALMIVNGTILSMSQVNMTPKLELHGTIKAKGDMVFNGDKDWMSVESYGKIYASGDVAANFKIVMSNAEMYVGGNVTASNNSKTDSNAYNFLDLSGTCNLYVGGSVGTKSSAERHFYMHDGTGSVVSIYGYDRDYTLQSSRKPFVNVKEFCNTQSNSVVYIGDGRLADNNYATITISFPNTFQNYGTLYCYDKLELTGSAKLILSGYGSSTFEKGFSVASGDITVSNAHTLYCQSSASFANLIFSGGSRAVFTNSVTSSGTISASGSSRILCNTTLKASALNISESSRLVCKGNLTVDTINVSNKSKVWGMKTVESSNINIDSDTADYLSELYCGQGSKVRSGGQLVINGGFYTPSQDLDGQPIYNLSKLEIGQYGRFVCPETVYVAGYFYIKEGGLFYATEKLTISGCTITSYGNMYLMGGVDMSASNATNTYCDITLGPNSDTFIASNSADGLGSLDYKGYFCGQGNLYIENNLNINGYYNGKAADYVQNRLEAFIVQNGNTYVSGDISINDHKRAFYVEQNSSVSCKNLNVGSAIYNLGKLIILDNLNYYNDGEFSDYEKYDSVSNLKKGFSIRNGGSEKTHITTAVIYIGGSNGIKIGGSLQNWGSIYCNGGANIQGYYSSSTAPAADIAFLNQDGAIAHFAGNMYMNSNAMLNGVDSVFATEGNFKFGCSLYNCGTFIVTGTITNDEQTNETVNNRSYRDSSSTAIRNGSYTISKDLDSTTYPNSLIYCGGDMKLGTSESAGNSGSFISFGTAYIGGKLLCYTNKDNSYYRTALWLFNDTKTFVSENVFAGAGVVVGEDSIFMCGGDYQSKRSTKLNCRCGASSNVYKEWYTYYDDNEDSNDDELSSAYVYVGGNMLVNTLGKNVRAMSAEKVPKNYSRNFDIYSNANIYVGGSLYANSKVVMKQNVTMLIAGQKSISSGSSLDTILDSLENGTIRNTIQNLIDGTDYKFFAYQSLDENICSRLAVNGDMYVRDTCKMRDMVKNYIYGDFNCDNYVEIGKSLYDDDRDQSQAVEELYRAKGETKVKYIFSNAGEMYVDGDFDSRGYTKVYASTTLRVKGDFVSHKYLTLRHDAKIYVGKKLKAANSIDGGSYSQFHIAGSMQALTSFIKLRDCTTVVVGGNMTAMRYIELGKYGDYTRTVTETSAGKYTVSESDIHGVTEGEECEYNDSDDDETGDKIGESTDAGDDSTAEEAIKDTQTLDTEAELADDKSDLAKGGQFYIGKTLASYTSYIKEFAYSRVAVGEYVFTPKYITLRHNSDMWVMPETFDNDTFIKKQYVSQSDGTLLGDIIDKVKEIGFNIQQTFSPKNGSIYTLGQLTLNKNASLMGTYDTIILGQCVLRQDALVYMGHNFECSAPNVNLTWDSITGETSVVGFDSYGTASDSSNNTAFPVVVFANNDIKITTTIDMKLTYLVANLGDVELYNIYSKSENAEYNAKQLPNAVASYYGDIDYFAMYGKIGALFYAPNGNLDIDGYYTEIWGCGLGDTVDVNAYYFNMHRFTNWRTMNLHIAESSSVFLVSKSEYENAEDNVDDIYMTDRDTAIRDMSNGANLFFNFGEEG